MNLWEYFMANGHRQIQFVLLFWLLVVAPKVAVDHVLSCTLHSPHICTTTKHAFNLFKTKIMAKRFMFTLAMLFFFAANILAQDVSFPDISTLTPETLFNATIEPLFGLVVVLSGYLSAWIPGLKKIAPFYRVLAFALATGLGFSLYGVSFWKLASTYIISSGLYLVILKNIIASPKLPGTATPGIN